MPGRRSYYSEVLADLSFSEHAAVKFLKGNEEEVRACAFVCVIIHIT
jgi:hypothetical protein